MSDSSRLLSALLLALTSACNNQASTVDMDGPDLAPVDLLPSPPDLTRLGTDVFPAPHSAPPQAKTNGGAMLTSLVMVPVFFSNDDMTERTELETFLSTVGASSYWTTAGGEYGLGAATAATPVELTETATGTLDDADIKTWLAAKLNGTSTLPGPTDNTLYVLNYPAGVTVTLTSQQGTTTSCVEFGGYHDNITLDSAHQNRSVAYAVIPRCAGERGLSVVDTATATISHELLEAATDPYPQIQPGGYDTLDDAHFYWEFVLSGAEIGDLCAQEPSSFVKFPGLPYTVQRTWSNASANAGHDPCVPVPAGEVYFNSIPKLDDNIAIFGLNMAGVSVPVGTKSTIDVELFSDADTSGPWTVKASEFAGPLAGGPATLKLSFDKSSGRNGEVLHLTIEALAANQFGASTFVIVSKLGTQTHRWFGLVGTP